MLSSIFKALFLSCWCCLINVTAITDTPTYWEPRWSTCCRQRCFPMIALFVFRAVMIVVLQWFHRHVFFHNLVFLLLFPGYRRYLLVSMKPWIQATWLLAQITVSAFSHLFYHACAWEPPSWVTLSGWFYCCQVAVVLNKKAALGVTWRDACVCQNQHMLVWFVSVCCYES